MIFETNLGPMSGINLLEELAYISYSTNREISPHIPPERYTAMGFQNVPAMEERFQTEQAKAAA